MEYAQHSARSLMYAVGIIQ